MRVSLNGAPGSLAAMAKCVSLASTQDILAYQPDACVIAHHQSRDRGPWEKHSSQPDLAIVLL